MALMMLVVSAVPASAQEQVRIGLGYGLAFLPIYICEDQRLVEKHAKALHLDVKANYQHFSGAGPVEEAIASGAVDMGPFGTAPLLKAWENASKTPRQIFAISGITTMHTVLLTDRPDVRSIADLKSSDRIALPTLSSPQMYFLEMQAEKTFDQYDHLRGQVIALSHPEAIAALAGGASAVTVYFSSPPFTQLAARGTNVHPILLSTDVMNGNASFLIMGATKAYIEAHPQIPEVIEKAIDDAARLIRTDPHRAAQIYLTYEPSMAFDAATIEAVLKEIKDEFGSPVYGVQAFADFMHRHGELKTPPQSWKEIVAPALLSSPST